MTEDRTYTFEEILQYLDGDMPQSERAAFEESLQSNTILAQEVEEAKALIQGAIIAGERETAAIVGKMHAQLKGTGLLDALHEQAVRPGTGRILGLPRKQLLAVAAVLLVAVIAAAILLTPSKHERLFADYFSPETVFATAQIEYLERSGFAAADKAQRDALREALALYRDGDYARAVDAFNTYHNGFNKDDVSLLYLGLSYLAMNKTDDALDALVDLRRQLDSASYTAQSGSENSGPYGTPYPPYQSIRNVAKWSLGLVYLKKSETETAQGIFTEIARDSTSPYQTQAQEVLSKLEQ